MFQPEIWGPVVWNLLFSIVFKCSNESISDIKLMVKLMEKVIPCTKCRKSYIQHRQRLDKKYDLSSVHAWQLWMFDLKNMVNKSLNRNYTPTMFEVVVNRYKVYDHTVHDLNLADTMVCIALYAKDNECEEECATFCHTVGRLLAQFIRGPYPSLLQNVGSPCAVSNLNATNALRQMYGLSLRSLDHYNVAL